MEFYLSTTSLYQQLFFVEFLIIMGSIITHSPDEKKTNILYAFAFL